MKKILFLSPLPPPVYGSAMSSKMILESRVIRDGFDIRNIKLNYSEHLKDVGKMNVKKMLGFFRVIFSIKKQLLSFKPDLVYFNIAPTGSGFMRDAMFALICKAFRKKMLYHLRGRGIRDEMKSPLKHFLYKLVFRNSKAIILSERLYEDVEKLFRHDDVFVLPNAIPNTISDSDIEVIVRGRKKKKVSQILFLSNMDETKGPLILLRACKLLKDKGMEFRCVFAGAWQDDGFRHRFMSYIESNKLNSYVKCIGFADSKAKKKLLSESDIMAFPTYYRLETFGLVILEAMKYGMPVVANGIASIPETVVHGKTGFVMKDNTPEELAAYLEILLRDRKKASLIGAEGRERFISNYEFSVYETAFSALLKKLLVQ